MSGQEFASQRRVGPSGRRAAQTIEDGGFALVEVLVSMVILAIIIAGGTTAVVSGSNSNIATQSRVTATNIAQQAVEKAEATAVSALTSISYNVGAYTVYRTVVFPTGGTCPTVLTPTSSNSVLVQVRVTPQSATANARGVQIDTALSC